MAEIENNTFSRLLRISNIHSVNSNDTNSNFTINLNRMTETNNIIRCVCKSVSFQNNSYNINSLNNVIYFTATNTGGSPTIASFITVPIGFYTVNELMAVMETLINIELVPVTGTVTFALQPYTYLISYTTNGLDGIRFLTEADNPLSTLSTTLGLIVSPSEVPILTFQEVPQLSGLEQVFVHSTTIAEGNLVDGDVENHDILSEIPIDVPFGARVFYESRDDELDSINYRSERNFDTITIQLRDNKNNIIKLNGGITTVILKLYYL